MLQALKEKAKKGKELALKSKEKLEEKLEKKKEQVLEKIAELKETDQNIAERAMDHGNEEKATKYYIKIVVKGLIQTSLSMNVARKVKTTVSEVLSINIPLIAVTDIVTAEVISREEKIKLIIDGYVHYFKAMYFFQRNKKQKTIEQLNLAINCCTGEAIKYLPYYYYLLAKLQYENGNYEEAKQSIKTALQHVKNFNIVQIAWKRDASIYASLDCKLKITDLDYPFYITTDYSSNIAIKENDLLFQAFPLYEDAIVRERIARELLYMQGMITEKKGLFKETVFIFMEILETYAAVPTEDQEEYSFHQSTLTAIEDILQSNSEWLFNNFNMVTEQPEKLNLDLLNEMFGKVMSIFDFKFPYTLANILRREKFANVSEINQLIYVSLKEVANNYIVDSPCVKLMKLTLRSAFHKGIISRGQKYEIDNIAESKKIFSDIRFKMLKNQVRILERNTYKIATELRALKGALKEQAMRRAYLSIVTAGLAFVGGAIITEVLENIADLSDLEELGTAIFDISSEEVREILHNAQDYLKDEQLRSTIVDKIKGACVAKITESVTSSFNPEEFLVTWMETSLTLQSPHINQNLITHTSFFESPSHNFKPTKNLIDTQYDTAFAKELYARAQEGYKFTAKTVGSKLIIECIAAKLDDPELEEHLEALKKLFEKQLENLSYSETDVKLVISKHSLEVNCQVPTLLKSIKKLLQEAMEYHPITQEAYGTIPSCGFM